MRNALTELKAILGEPPLQIGTVVAVSTADVRVELPGGQVVSVRGEAAVDDKVFIRNGVIEGPAPDLPIFTIDV